MIIIELKIIGRIQQCGMKCTTSNIPLNPTLHVYSLPSHSFNIGVACCCFVWATIELHVLVIRKYLK